MKTPLRIIGIAALVIAALSLTILTGCTTSGGFSFDGGKVEATNQELTVTLDGNPTTGYEWTADVSGDNIQAEDQTYTQTTTVGTTTGTSGSYEFKFTGKSAGNCTITFTYARSWETTDSDQTVVLNVTTGSNGSITKLEAQVDGQMVGYASM